MAPTTVASDSPSPPPRAPIDELTHDSIELTDSTRDGPARGGMPAAAERSMRVLIVRPAGTLTSMPLIVFAQGFDSEPETYLPLLELWAHAGYLVAAPELPGSARDLPGIPTRDDLGEAARDLSFVITSMLAGADGAVDPTRIAVAGHSDGGSIVATLALNTAYRDPRIRAYLVLSGVLPVQVTDGTWDIGDVFGPLLVVVGTSDEYGNLAGSTSLYELAPEPKMLLTVPGGDHLDMYIGIGPTPEAVRAATTRFFDAALATDTPARGLITPAAARGRAALSPIVERRTIAPQ